MEQQGENRKMTGELKRKEIAQRLGQGWQFFKNYQVISQKSVEYSKEGVGGITSALELQKKCGEIEDWRGEEPAFNDTGEEILFSQGRAAYIKPKPQPPTP